MTSESVETTPAARPPEATPKATTGTNAKKKGMQPGSFASRLVALFETRPDHPFTIAEVFAAVGEGKTKRGLRSALFDLLTRKKIRRIDEGIYQAVAKGALTP